MNRYKAKNLEDPSTEEKIKDLSAFITASKFGMMTTKASDTGLLASRCMALAAQVSPTSHLLREASPAWLSDPFLTSTPSRKTVAST